MHQGSKLKYLAERSGKTNAELAQLSGISEASLYSYFNQEEISSKKLKKICEAMGWSLSVFFEMELNEDAAPYGLQAMNEALQREIELLKKQLAAKEEIIDLLKQSKIKTVKK